MSFLKSILKQQLLVLCIIILLVSGCSSPAEKNTAQEMNKTLEQLAPNVFKLKPKHVTLALLCQLIITYADISKNMDSRNGLGMVSEVVISGCMMFGNRKLSPGHQLMNIRSAG